MVPRTIDAVGLGPTGNLQGSISYFSLVTGQVLNLLWIDTTVLKMLTNAINRINFMVKKQKSVKGLKFCDRQNIIDQLISAGVNCATDNMKDTGYADEVEQHDVNYEISNTEEVVGVGDANDDVEEETNEEERAEIDDSNESDIGNTAENITNSDGVRGICAQNTADEFLVP